MTKYEKKREISLTCQFEKEISSFLFSFLFFLSPFNSLFSFLFVPFFLVFLLFSFLSFSFLIFLFLILFLFIFPLLLCFYLLLYLNAIGEIYFPFNFSWIIFIEMLTLNFKMALVKVIELSNNSVQSFGSISKIFNIQKEKMWLKNHEKMM